MINQKHDEAYQEAVRFLRKMRELMGTLGRQEAFRQYLVTIRGAHKPKRNFIKRLEQARLDTTRS